MPKVVWTSENDRRLLIRLIERSAKSYDTVELSKLFPGATPKAIEERIAKLKREAKTMESETQHSSSNGVKSGPRKRGLPSNTGGSKRSAKRKGSKFSSPETARKQFTDDEETATPLKSEEGLYGRIFDQKFNPDEYAEAKFSDQKIPAELLGQREIVYETISEADIKMEGVKREKFEAFDDAVYID
ncbi:hypothetical protein RUND412_003884 [Rhizina undulata]